MGGVLNVLTGFFCDAAMQATQQDRENVMREKQEEEEKFRDQLMRVFNAADKDHSGTVTRQEFEEAIEDKQFRLALHGLGIHASEAKGLFTLLDHGSPLGVDLSEFMNGCLRVIGV